MPLTVTQPVVSSANTSNASSYAMATFTPTAGALLVLWVSASETTAAGSVTNTGTTLTWIKQGSVAWNSGANTLYCFTAKVPVSTSSTTITFDCTGDAATGAILELMEITGHNSFSAVNQFVTNSGLGATYSITRAAANTNNVYLAAVSKLQNSAVFIGGFGLPTSWTKLDDRFYSTPNNASADIYRIGGETSTTVSCTGLSIEWAMAYLEIWRDDIGPYRPYNHGGLIG